MPSVIDISDTHLALLNEKYKSLSPDKPRKIRRSFNKAISKFRYYDVQYLINRFPDALDSHQNTKLFKKLRRLLVDYEIFNTFNWKSLSKYERYMICDIIDYKMFKNLYESKLINTNAISDIMRYANLSYKGSIVRYLVNVVRYAPPMSRMRYTRFLNEIKLYMIIRKITSRINNDLLDILPVTYHIYSFMVNINKPDYDVLCYYADDVTFSQVLYEQISARDAYHRLQKIENDALITPNNLLPLISNNKDLDAFYHKNDFYAKLLLGLYITVLGINVLSLIR